MYTIFWHDAWKVLLNSLILGSGLPVVYALGIRSLALGSSGTADQPGTEHVGRHPLGVALAAVCMLVVLVGVGLGISYIIAAGHAEQLSFEHGYPTFVPEE